jgi:tyramine---L-glutamate ligase
MKVLLYEHVSSGGYAGQPINSSLLSEGYGMLRGLTSDFKAAGYEVTVLLDSRIAQLNPLLDADQIVQIGPEGEADPSMEEVAESSDLAYVIAPEPNHLLQSIIECIETTSTLSLNCNAAAIEQVADKANVFDTASKLNLNFPKTLTFQGNATGDTISGNISEKLTYPIVLKPAHTAGCGGLSFVASEDQLVGAVRKTKVESAFDNFLAQQYIDGIPVSVSVICNGDEAIPVSLNFQDITLASSTLSSYNGGLVPFDHILKKQAFDTAKHLVEAFRGLRGYVGVDLVLAKDGIFVMEINPRLTTSYIGLREVAEFNLADFIVNAVTKNALPRNIKLKNYCTFKKIQVCTLSALAWKQICNEESVISPPFPIPNVNSMYALIKTKGSSPSVASENLSSAKKCLEHLVNGGR